MLTLSVFFCASQVKVHYTGKLKDGTEFDTSAGRGKTATINSVVYVYVNDVNIFTLPKGNMSSPSIYRVDTNATAAAEK